ncbi:hypothetical protein GJAV_G00049030 [Gymnothorax javanicus]|nr:hypothetical protein GJAV_G00049030 [Gymnothorax javanicus]
MMMDYEGETDIMKQRAAFFTAAEQETIIAAYNDYVHIFRKKSNTTVAARERQLAWKKIADRVNACNPGDCKRTWQQVKIKYKNIVQTANRKKAEARRLSGGDPVLPAPAANALVLSDHADGPVGECIPGGSSSDSPTLHDTSTFIKGRRGGDYRWGVHRTALGGPWGVGADSSPGAGPYPSMHCAGAKPGCLKLSPEVETPAFRQIPRTQSLAVPVSPPEVEPRPFRAKLHTQSLAVPTSPPEVEPRTFRQNLRTQSMAASSSPPAAEPSTFRQNPRTAPVEELYKIHLDKKIQKADLEMTHLKLQIRKTELETAILEHQLMELQRK